MKTTKPLYIRQASHGWEATTLELCHHAVKVGTSYAVVGPSKVKGYQVIRLDGRYVRAPEGIL